MTDENAEENEEKTDKPTPRKYRNHGDGGLYWDKDRERWTAEITIGYRPNGRRIVRKARGKTKTEATKKLKEIQRDLDDGHKTKAGSFTVADAVRDWLTYGQHNRAESTKKTTQQHADKHIIPALGARQLRELTPEEVEDWLIEKSAILASSTLSKVRSILKRSIDRAQSRDRVKRNVVVLCETPKGRPGRPSKALTFDQAETLLDTAAQTRMNAYIVLSLLTGARTEELRALTWDHVDLFGKPDATPPVPPSMMVWTADRESKDTKTKKSRRTLALPQRCVDVLLAHWEEQADARARATKRDLRPSSPARVRAWTENALVFPTSHGTVKDARNVRLAFRRVVKLTGLAPADWTPRELRHSFVSLLSASGVAIEDISRLVGHESTLVTETVYRHQIKPVIQEGAQAMDALFPNRNSDR